MGGCPSLAASAVPVAGAFPRTVSLPIAWPVLV